MLLPFGKELGLLAAQSAFGLALAGTGPREAGFELRHHDKDVHLQPADGVGRLCTEPPISSLVSTRTSPFDRHRFLETRPLPVGTGQAVVDVDPFGLNPEPSERIALGGGVLIVRRDPGFRGFAVRMNKVSRTRLAGRWTGGKLRGALANGGLETSRTWIGLGSLLQ